ncbi:InlB B-repeat-containing protein [Rubritalea tangerina]|uniref:Bacterial repeat domain-containing protein n=1 Tax=Rubritalea tangerina TaxID=430798 RepID=A0ABW4Z8Z8_9BACT
MSNTCLNAAYLLSALVLCSLLLGYTTRAAEWNGGEDWDLFDCPERRAMWVWSPVSMTGTKTENRSWDPTPSTPRNAQDRFFENYKGSQDLLFDFCQNKSIRVLYFFNGVWEWDQTDFDATTPRIPNETAFASFVAEAKRRGIQVWLMTYLWDDPNDARMTQSSNKQAIKRMAQAVHNFNLSYPDSPLAGLHLDQEPGDTTVYDDLLDTMKIAQDWIDSNATGLLISQALRPKWRNQNITWNGSTKPMNEHIMEIIDHGAYMSYNDDLSVVHQWLPPIINHANAHGKKIASGFEVTDYKGMWPNSDEETWWEEIRNEPLATRFKVDPSGPVTFEDAMHDVVANYAAQPGYDRQVIHSYADYFEHWFGQRPRDYILSLPNETYDSENENPAKVDLFADTRELVGITPNSEEHAQTSTFALTVIDGSGSATLEHGQVAHIIANTAPAGYHFAYWSSSAGGSFANAQATNTQFTMPNNATEVTANYQLNDYDGNSLNDAWERTHFDNAGSTSPNADEDGDGFSNFEEMVFGLDPNQKDPAHAATHLQVVQVEGTTMLQFSFRRPLNHGSLDVSYHLESCSQLCDENWTVNTTPPSFSDDGTIQWVSYLLPIELQQSFFRCTVTSNP